MIEVKEIKDTKYILTLTERQMKILGAMCGFIGGVHQDRTDFTDKIYNFVNKKFRNFDCSKIVNVQEDNIQLV